MMPVIPSSQGGEVGTVEVLLYGFHSIDVKYPVCRRSNVWECCKGCMEGYDEPIPGGK